LLFYLSYLFISFAIRKDCRVQTKQKFTQKQSYKTHPFYQKWKPRSCLFTFG